jgi:uncharacterized repeat protein (TIGR03803 family)
VSRQSGGANGIGAVYKLSHNPVGEWAEEVLYSFQQGTDGNSPISNLVFDAAGNLYGTTSEGGLGSGTIFKLSPVGAGKWTETVVHAFEGPPDGGFAYNGIGGRSIRKVLRCHGARRMELSFSLRNLEKSRPRLRDKKRTKFF